MLRVIYEDEAILVAEKPAGVESQASAGFSRDMVSEIKKYLVKNGSGRDPYVGVIHRLDKPVRGIMVYGKTKDAAAKLSRQMAEQGHMEKGYLALICGKPLEKSGQLVDNLYFDRERNLTRVVEETEKEHPEWKAASKQARLEYQVLEDSGMEQLFAQERSRLCRSGVLAESEETTLLKIRLYTGRHHQIRVQLAHAGLPILGDVKYNPAMEQYRGSSALCLCAWEIGFTHPVSGKRVRFHL